jgi:hypothetical protein
MVKNWGELLMLRTFGPKRKRQLFQRLSLGNWAAFRDSRKASLENVFIKPKSLNSPMVSTPSPGIRQKLLRFLGEVI